MEQQIRDIIAGAFSDLEAACAAVGENLDAESLADFVGDRMFDDNAEYRAMPYTLRRNRVLKICAEYV